MKTRTTLLYLFAMALTVLSGCIQMKDLSRQLSNKDYLSTFSNSVIIADENYFTRAVLDYHLNKAVLRRFGDEMQNPNDSNKLWMFLDFTKAQTAGENALSLAPCLYRIPMNFEDLNSGFEYRYYAFSGDMKASMQAFGINDTESNSSTQYLVIDYIQYKDCSCDGLPTIRYAVGLRTELKFVRLAAKTKFENVGSLRAVAAQVELGLSKVTFTLKTIGLSGIDARVNIPSGVDFDVTSYRDFQNAVDFLKKMEQDGVKKDGLVVFPMLIPIMDDYRPNMESSLYDMVREIDKLKRMRNRIIHRTPLLDRFPNKLNRLTENDGHSLLKKQLGLIDEQIDFYMKQRDAYQYAEERLLGYDNRRALIELATKIDTVAPNQKLWWMNSDSAPPADPRRQGK